MARQVYARLLKSIGSPADAPVLQLVLRSTTNQGNQVAYWPGNPGRIEINEAVVEMCMTFGADADDALACLLGHELAHFQYRHGGKQGFFSPVVMPNGKPYSSENIEAIADRAGVFMAYMAGYESFEIAPVVYREFYDMFKLPDKKEGYPNKEERLRLVADTTARVRELACYFELGEVQYLLHDYAAASQTFLALVSRYPTAVTLNNLGVTKLNQALMLMTSARDEPRLRFAFPIEFDADNRLLTNPRRGDPDAYQPLLTDARHLFGMALAEQPTHQAATLNLALTHYLLGDIKQARQTLLFRQPPNQSLSANALLVLAIISANQKQSDQVRKLFGQSIKLGAYRASDNSQLFEQSQKPGWLRYWSHLVVRRQSNQSFTKPNPARAVRPGLHPTVRPILVLGESRGYRTDSSSTYELPIVENGKIRRYRVEKTVV